MPLSSGINWNSTGAISSSIYRLDATLKWHQLKLSFCLIVEAIKYWMPLSSGINWNVIIMGTKWFFSLDATLKWHQLKPRKFRNEIPDLKLLDATLKWHQLKLSKSTTQCHLIHWMPLSSGINWNTRSSFLISSALIGCHSQVASTETVRHQINSTSLRV